MFSTSFSLVALSLVLPTLVSAHGYVAQVTVNGQNYSGGTPNSASGPVRQVNTVSPVTSTGDTDLSCGHGAQPASQTVNASPGSEIAFGWSGGGGGQWPHEVGPLMTYMASCGGSCANFNSADAQWFKIAESGQSGRTWTQHLGIKNGQPSTATIPYDLAPGEYLIRNEIIALHNAMSVGGAEFYPSCTQIRVDGNGSGRPSNTVTFPGGYSANDKGLVFDAYTPGAGTYTFPGPAIASRSEEGADRKRSFRFARDI
ncbi:glycoside hydrolase [Pterulicium gracile]|uniref:lytic cellulose monooxygenase (C4-dehydrogenating) n=1 Tax=Pterulicium gracile TaxID=1884261 RepID=A0A5C3R0L4_9AGAR|nr:glycoside hydrolase [Pterula gracilis]